MDLIFNRFLCCIKQSLLVLIATLIKVHIHFVTEILTRVKITINRCSFVHCFNSCKVAEKWVVKFCNDVRWVKQFKLGLHDYVDFSLLLQFAKLNFWGGDGDITQEQVTFSSSLSKLCFLLQVIVKHILPLTRLAKASHSKAAFFVVTNCQWVIWQS